VSEPALFLLDAHWSGGVTSDEGDECPCWTRFAVIDGTDVPHIVVIVDARPFLVPPPLPHKAKNWPSVDQVCRALTARFVASVCVLDDMIIRVPPELRVTLTDHYQRQYSSQLHAGQARHVDRGASWQGFAELVDGGSSSSADV